MRKIGKYLLIPLLFLVLFSLSMDSAEATTVVFNNVSAGNYDGTMNMTVNISGVVGIIDAGIANVTFYATGQDGVKITLGTTANNSDNQTMFELAYDTTGMPDQSYSFDATAQNHSATGTDATQVTAIVFDNAALSMSWEATTSGYNNTDGGLCPKSSTLYFGITGSDDEMINANPVLYFKSKGSNEAYTNTYTISRVGASNNYTTTSNYTFTSLFSLPADDYNIWAQYQDTDGTYINTSQLDLQIKCQDGIALNPEILEGETTKEKQTEGIIVILIIIGGLWLLSKVKG